VSELIEIVTTWEVIFENASTVPIGYATDAFDGIVKVLALASEAG
jgi:hypothetical protein